VVASWALLLLCAVGPSGAVPGVVVLQHPPAGVAAAAMEANLAAVLGQLETGAVASVAGALTPAGQTALERLLAQVQVRNTRPVHEVQLLRLPANGQYEVRDIRVQVGMGATPGNPYQDLVFTLQPDGRIDDVRFAMEARHYAELVQQGEELQDFVVRQQIIQSVELLRTAYNRRDLEYIERVFSNDALIIVGRILESKPELPGQDRQLAGSSLGQDRIEFIRRTKGEYLESLRQVFARNDFLKVDFDSLSVVRDPSDPAIYGVSLKQRWASSRYSDTGYVFLLLDFVNADRPVIHVRSWQPEPFADGSTVTLQDFEIIRVESP
jgi:hypothetical protein